MELTQEEKDLITEGLQAIIDYELDEEEMSEEEIVNTINRIAELQKKLGLGFILVV